MFAFSQSRTTPRQIGAPFDLARVCAATATVACPLCRRLPAIPCTIGWCRRGWHVARFGRAMKAGVITGPDLIAVLYVAGVFTPATVVEDGAS